MGQTLTVVTAGELLPGLTLLGDAFLGGDHAARHPRALQRADPMGPSQGMTSAALGQQPEMLLRRSPGGFPVSDRPSWASQRG